jgi:5-methylcytosine rRNA methyltransferase NSUN4
MIENSEFQNHFSKEFGPRWSLIFKSLNAPPLQCLRSNQFFQTHSKFSENEKELIFDNCFLPDQNKIDDLQIRDEVFKYYLMDPASFFVAKFLPISPGDRVLDMCAAPGGKSLILAEKLFLGDDAAKGELICNELSNPRRERLKYILQNYIPRGKRDSVFIKGIDANYYGQREPQKFDAILLDAPCTGERHLLEDTAEFKKWTLKRSKNNSMRQFSLISSAWHAARIGGYIMYSTCSISSIENDAVVKKLLHRRAVEIVELDSMEHYPFIERTEFGYQILPDSFLDSGRLLGAGPMYFSLIRKLDELATETL